MNDHETPGTNPTQSGCNCCNTTSAGAVAIAMASAVSSAVAVAIARIALAILILIGIGVIAIAIAMAFAFASALALIVVIVIIIIVIIVIIIVIVFLRRTLRCYCLINLDVPSQASLSDPLRPAVVWQTIEPRRPFLADCQADRVDILHSTDGGLNYSPVPIDANTTATGLPVTGSFIWQAVDQFAPGTLLLLVAVTYDASGQELCRSLVRQVRVVQ